MRSTCWSAAANVPCPMMRVKLASEVRSTLYCSQALLGGLKPVLYCQKLVAFPIAKWISSGSAPFTSLSHSTTLVTPEASQSPWYSLLMQRAPRWVANGVEISRNPSPAPPIPPLPGFERSEPPSQPPSEVPLQLSVKPISGAACAADAATASAAASVKGAMIRASGPGATWQARAIIG